MHVALATGDLADPAAFRNALRGVRTVVHLAGSERDQPGATLEELDGARHLAAAARRRARAGRALRCGSTPLGATPHHPSRVHRAKALAEARGRGRRGSRPPRSRPRCSTRPATAGWRGWSGWRWLPAVPLTGRGAARTQPLWAEDAADGVVAALDRGAAATRARPRRPGAADPPRGRRAGAARRRPPPPARARSRSPRCGRPCTPSRRWPGRPRSRPGTRR